MDNIDLEEAHKHSINNKREIEKSDTCGCFYCREIFVPSEIKDWVKDSKDSTALCPYCKIDTVIGNASGYDITLKFLQSMYSKYFEE